MKNIKFSLINIDQTVKAETELDIHDSMGKSLKDFLTFVEHEVESGETAHLEIEGVEEGPITFAIGKEE